MIFKCFFCVILDYVYEKSRMNLATHYFLSDYWMAGGFFSSVMHLLLAENNLALPTSQDTEHYKLYFQG